MPKLNSFPFLKKIITLFSGTVLAQLINILLIPIITRFYLPEEVGVSETFVAFVLTFAVAINGGVELAIMLPKEKQEALQISRLGLTICTGFSLLLGLILLIFQYPLLEMMHLPVLNNWILLLPVSLFLEGCLQNLRILLNRNAEYANLSTGKVVNILVRNGSSIAFAFLGMRFELLIIAFVAGQFFNLCVYVWGCYPLRSDFWLGNTRSLFPIAYKYKDFVQFATISTALSTFSKRLPFFLLPYFYLNSETLLGIYSQADKILMIPYAVSFAVGDVFYQKATELRDKDPKVLEAFTLKILGYLLLVGFIPYLFLGFADNDVFGWLLGKKYAQAGLFSQYFALQAYLLFAISPITVIIDIKRKLKAFLQFNIGLFVARFLLLYISLHYLSEIQSLKVYGIGCGILILFQYAYIYYEVIKKPALVPY